MYNNNFMIDRLTRQKDEIDNLIRSYQNTQTPVNNFITSGSTQTPQKDLVEWRILNENEEVDNLFVANKTLFINDNIMILKGVDGKLEKWNIKKIYPKDKKDEKIQELENKIKELEMKINEPKQPNITAREFNQSYGNVNEYVESKPKTNVECFSNEE